MTSFNIPQSAADKVTTLTQCIWLFETSSFKYKLRHRRGKKKGGEKKKKRLWYIKLLQAQKSKRQTEKSAGN